jgi:hypothetical protein
MKIIKMHLELCAGIILLILLFGCAKKQNVFLDPHFYYNKENYTFIRVNPETRDEDIKKYLERLQKTIFKYVAPKPKLDTFTEYELPPRPKKIVVPKYPEDLKKQGYSGKVILKLLIDEHGLVILAKPSRGGQKLDKIGILFIKAALESAIQTEFYPARIKGKPVKVWVSYPIRFILTTH